MDHSFRVATIESLATCPSDVAEATFTLYRGATPDNRVDVMFSFAPCLPYDGEGSRFARPKIELPGIVNATSTQTPAGANRPRQLEDAILAWRGVVDQVRRHGRHGLTLGTKFELPLRSRPNPR